MSLRKLGETDDERARRIVLDNLNENRDKMLRTLRNLIASTIVSYLVSKSRGYDFFEVGAGPGLWFVCDENGVIDGPFSKQKASDIASAMQMTVIKENE